MKTSPSSGNNRFSQRAERFIERSTFRVAIAQGCHQGVRELGGLQLPFAEHRGSRREKRRTAFLRQGPDCGRGGHRPGGMRSGPSVPERIRHLRVVHLFKIVVFALKPEHRHKCEEGILLLQSGCQADRRERLEYGVKCSAENADLLSGHDGICSRILEGGNVLQGFRRSAEALVLFAEDGGNGVAITRVFLLLPEDRLEGAVLFEAESDRKAGRRARRQ